MPKEGKREREERREVKKKQHAETLNSTGRGRRRRVAATTYDIPYTEIYRYMTSLRVCVCV